MKKFCVYCYTFPNGKVYIGKAHDLKVRNRQHETYASLRKYKYRFYYAINKYGFQNLKLEILASDLSNHEACELEKYFIALSQSTKPSFGYNMTKGGDGVSRQMSEETRRKISIANLGKKISEAHKLKCLENGKRSFLGKNHSEHTKAILSEINSKPVIRNDGRIFKNLKEAAKEIGVTSALISSTLKNKSKHANGYTFAYYVPGTPPPEPIKTKVTKKRKLIWEGIEYPSITRAAKALGIPKSVFFRKVKKMDIGA